MSDDATRFNRKRAADKQGSRDGDDGGDDEFISTPQVASAEVMATRRIVTVRRPQAPEAAAAAAPSPFNSVLGSFGAATAAVAPSPFAAFGSTPAPPRPVATGFGATTAIAPSPFAAFGAAPAPPKPVTGGFNFGIAPPPAAVPVTVTPQAPAAPSSGFNFSFGGNTTAAGDAAAPKFDFAAAVGAFSAAAANAASKQTTAAADDGEGDEDPEAEVAIAAGVPTLAATEVKTGEEGDVTLFEAHTAKLFNFHADEKSWNECGAGSLKISNKADGTSTRVVMRDNKLKKVLLNCTLAKDSFRLAQKQEKMFSFSAPNNGGAVGTFLVKMTGASAADDTKAFLAIAEKHLA